ncbi:hypothetical protein L0024_03455 [Pseudomonas aeruginosa]|uniref:hypothetical protein n=1 Tax=Pseudomonas aeruginosa TaxID=287 RepID=UPI001FF8681F|nr:hypothetical protein [Pseudomonas aeruginosa]UPG01617.1 hypothetical protein L0024_03455 [Pseudomonas aeruginosa]
MQFRLISAFFLFLGSYFPLAIILAVQDIPWSWWSRPICTAWSFSACDFVPFENPIYSIVFLTLAALSTGIAQYTLSNISFPHRVKIVSCKSIPNDIINYVFPYVVSFMGISYSEPGKMLGFAIFLIWMFAITYKSGQIIMNPLLIIFGWKLYEASVTINGKSREVRVLKRDLLLPGDQVAQKVQEFYICKD